MSRDVLTALNIYPNLDLYTTYQYVKENQMHPYTKVALECLEGKEFNFVDVGSGAISFTPFKMTNGVIHPTAEKVEIKRNEKNGSARSADAIAKELNEAFDNPQLKGKETFITGSEWLRSLDKGSQQDQKLKVELEKLQKEQASKGVFVSISVLSQDDEMNNSYSYFKHLLRFLDKNNPNLKNVNENNTGTCEVGNGSGQGSIMPSQKVATAGKTVAEKIKAGESVEKIVSEVSEIFFSDMISTAGLDNLFLQGLLAVTLSTKEVIEGLNIQDADRWKTCQCSCSVSEIIAVLKKQKADATFTTTLAFLTAVQKKYGNIEIFNMSKPMPLFDAEGKPLTFVDDKGAVQHIKAKINSAGGEALKVITDLFKRVYKINETRDHASAAHDSSGWTKGQDGKWHQAVAANG